MSIQHLAPDLIPSYLDALVRYRIRYIAGYPSSIATLAEEALRLGRDDLNMVVVLANSEPLLPHQREVIERAFHCPARETYGMAEMVASATECEKGRLHQWPEAGLIEVLDGQCPVPAGSPGELVCTGLLNADQPLIRYRVGDCGRVPPEDELCSCGRSLPLMTSVDGRTDDILYTPDGRRVYRMNPVLYGLPLREAQFVQESVNRMRVRVVPSAGFGAASEQALAARIRERMGDIGVHVEEVAEIARTATGKFRLVICQVPAAEREAVLAGRERAARRSA
jgi:phenylacetate-CoA ligase